MAVDKNLFMYDLSVVAIMKNEAPYVKEWQDYHLLAGVDHFFIYDNDSPDNLRMILQPYIDAGIVTYTFYPDKCRQMESYIDAVHRFKFFSRYIAWIDADEFIFPKSKPTIPEVVDEILSDKPNAAGLAVNWFLFGSNFQEKADYSRGVLERFTRRPEDDYAPFSDWAPTVHGGNAGVKTIANPRKVKVFHTPHSAQYFENFHAVNEKGNVVPGFSSYPVSTEKIVMNHYSLKSKEEYIKKVNRGNADHFDNHYDVRNFEKNDHNEVFDDSILKYRDARLAALTQMGGGADVLKILAASKKIDYNIIFNALVQNLSPTFSKNVSAEFLQGKLETFLTCRAVASYFKENLFDATTGNLFEEAALNAIYKTLSTNLQAADLRLLISDLPNILLLDYPVVDDIRRACIQIIPQFMHLFRVNNIWGEFTDLNYLLKMLQIFDA